MILIQFKHSNYSLYTDEMLINSEFKKEIIKIN